jgi:hypothetical protein
VDREWLEAELAAGRSIESIARDAGKHPSTIAYWIRKHGLASTHAARHAARGGLRENVLRDLIAQGRTAREIAAETGRSLATVRYWLKRYGLKTIGHNGRRCARSVARCDEHGEGEHVRIADGRLMCARCRADAVSRWRRRAKLTLVEEAGGRCVACGYDRCVAALHFHHVDPSEKRFAIGGRGLARAMEDLREEAKKCVLVCANCHAEVEAGFARLPFASRPE